MAPDVHITVAIDLPPPPKSVWNGSSSLRFAPGASAMAFDPPSDDPRCSLYKSTLELVQFYITTPFSLLHQALQVRRSSVGMSPLSSSPSGQYAIYPLCTRLDGARQAASPLGSVLILDRVGIGDGGIPTIHSSSTLHQALQVRQSSVGTLLPISSPSGQYAIYPFCTRLDGYRNASSLSSSVLILDRVGIGDWGMILVFSVSRIIFIFHLVFLLLTILLGALQVRQLFIYMQQLITSPSGQYAINLLCTRLDSFRNAVLFLGSVLILDRVGTGDRKVLSSRIDCLNIFTGLKRKVLTLGWESTGKVALGRLSKIQDIVYSVMETLFVSWLAFSYPLCRV